MKISFLFDAIAIDNSKSNWIKVKIRKDTRLQMTGSADRH